MKQTGNSNNKIIKALEAEEETASTTAVAAAAIKQYNDKEIKSEISDSPFF